MNIYKYVGQYKDKNKIKNFLKELVAKNKYRCKIIFGNKKIQL